MLLKNAWSLKFPFNFLESGREDLGAPGEIVVGKFAFEPVLMHDPIGLFTLGGSAAVKNQRLLHPDKRTGLRAVNLPVLPGCFPVASFRGPVGSEPSRVFPIAQAEKVPLLLAHLCLVCKINQHPTVKN